MQWVEENGIINEAQAGFRRNYSTVDHIFTLLTLVQKQLLNHGKLYVLEETTGQSAISLHYLH